MTGRRYTPGLLREIAEVFGEARALKFALAYGGQEIKIPKRPHDRHFIAVAVGLDLLRWLSARYPGENITIPTGARSVLAEQMALVDRLVEQGVSANEIVRQARVSIRTVYRARARRADDHQFDLFRKAS